MLSYSVTVYGNKHVYRRLSEFKLYFLLVDFANATTISKISLLTGYRTGLWASAVLLPLLGLTWTFGFLSVTSDETLVFTYLFTLFNSFQVDFWIIGKRF